MPLLCIPIAGGEETAYRLARGVFALSRPMGEVGGGSREAFSVVEHPDTGAVFVEIDTEALAPLHEDAPDMVPALLDIVADVTTAKEREELADLVRRNAGRRVPLVSLVPHAALLESITREQGLALGLYGPLPVPPV